MNLPEILVCCGGRLLAVVLVVLAVVEEKGICDSVNKNGHSKVQLCREV